MATNDGNPNCNYISRLQIGENILYDNNISVETIRKEIPSLQEVHNQGFVESCCYFACLECMRCRSCDDINLSVRHAINKLYEEEKKIVEGELSLVVPVSIMGMFEHIMSHGVYDAATEIPYILKPGGEFLEPMQRHDLRKLKKYTIKNFEVTDDVPTALEWLRKGPIVASFYYYKDLIAYRGTMHDVFTKAMFEKAEAEWKAKAKAEAEGGSGDHHAKVPPAHTVLLVGKGARKMVENGEEKWVKYFAMKNTEGNGWGSGGYSLVERDVFYIFGCPFGVQVKGQGKKRKRKH